MILWKVLCLTNITLNIFNAIIICMVLVQAVKKQKEQRKVIAQNTHYTPKRSKR